MICTLTSTLLFVHQLMWIFLISLTLVGVNREIKRGRFQEPFGEMMFETINSGFADRLRGRREGEKKGAVGIQEEFHTKREEDL
jgi:hypothetical protein